VSWDGSTISDQTDLSDFPYTTVTVDGLVASDDSTALTFGLYNLPDFFWLDDVSVVPN
jgi:hypothetical protein